MLADGRGEQRRNLGPLYELRAVFLRLGLVGTAKCFCSSPAHYSEKALDEKSLQKLLTNKRLLTIMGAVRKG